MAASEDNEKTAESHERAPSNPDDNEATPSAPPVAPSPPVKDGGARAWLQVAGSFLVFANLWGLPFAYGSFQTFYQLDYIPEKSASTISWVGTIATFLLIVIGIFSGPLFDRGYFRAMLLTGAFVETLGIFLLSLCDKYWQIMLTQGIMIGLGNGLLYIPGLALVGRSFQKHRSIAMALTTCGAPAGGIIYTIMFERLIDPLGFPWTIRAMGFFMLGSYLISFPLMLWRAENIGHLGTGQARKLFDVTALRDVLFWSYSFSNFFIFFGYMTPFIYIAAYGQTYLDMDRSMALMMIVIAQAASIVGRLAVGYAAAKIGIMIPWIACGLSSGIFCIAWIGVENQGSFIAFAVLYGAFSGALIPLPPSVFPHVCPDPKVLGARLGMAQAIGSVASLIGSPIAGALAEVNAAPGETNWLGLQLFSGLVMMLGGCQLIGLWALLVKKRDIGKLI
ncbi:MFS general substrate transporter [Hortaea werneckii]|nr:MFS general substrate transporter [Hortaea werneckii]